VTKRSRPLLSCPAVPPRLRGGVHRGLLCVPLCVLACLLLFPPARGLLVASLQAAGAPRERPLPGPSAAGRRGGDEPAATLRARLEEGRAALARGEPALVLERLGESWEEAPAEVLPLLLDACREGRLPRKGRALVEAAGARGDLPPLAIVAIAGWEAEEGFVLRAIRRVDAALSARARSPVLWSARARLARAVGDPAVAYAAAEEALECGAEAAPQRWIQGAAALELGRGEEGRALLRSLLADAPGHLAARMALAGDHRGRGEIDAALRLGWEVLERDPDHVAALQLVGGLLVREEPTRERGRILLARFRATRDRRERIDRLGREIHEGRDTPALRAELAERLLGDGRPREARAVAAGASSETPPALRARLLAAEGRAAWAVGDPAAALRALGSAVALDRSRSDLRLEIAEILIAWGVVARAIEVLDRVDRAHDPRRRAWLEVDCLARRGAGWEILAPRLQDLVLADPSDLPVLRGYVDVAVAFRRVDEATELLEGLPSSGAAGPPLRVARAWLADAAAASSDDAERSAREAALIEDDTVDGWLLLRERRIRRGDGRGAVEALSRARRARVLLPTEE
jgi:thioredoxin-like negative regulator of GroEL